MSASQLVHKARKENRMKNCNALSNRTTRRILPIACATALAVAFTVSLPQPAHADQFKPPRVPSNIQVPAGNTAHDSRHVAALAGHEYRLGQGAAT